MSTTDDIVIKITVEEIRGALVETLHSPYADLLATIIIGNLKNTDVGLTQLYKGLCGIKEKIPFKLLDKVKVKYRALNTWKYSEDQMKEQGLIHQDYVEGVIVSIDPYKRDCLTVQTNCIKDDGTVFKDTSEVTLKEVHFYGDEIPV